MTGPGEVLGNFSTMSAPNSQPSFWQSRGSWQLSSENRHILNLKNLRSKKEKCQGCDQRTVGWSGRRASTPHVVCAHVWPSEGLSFFLWRGPRPGTEEAGHKFVAAPHGAGRLAALPGRAWARWTARHGRPAVSVPHCQDSC
jgi:hypothetical protein